ncbi:MAG TPA: C25 family cysteine peptidase, partial [Hanamia sp.]
ANYFKNRINPGYAIPAGGIYVYSSSYDIGEGWSSWDAIPGRPLPVRLNDLNLYTAGPAASVKFAMAGSAWNGERNIKVKFNNTYIAEESMPYMTYIKKQIDNVPLSLFINTDYVGFYFENTSTIATDRCVVSYVELKYPSKWNFNNETNFYFELPATQTGNYLVIDNFKSDGVAPVLLDLISNNRYTGDITSTPGKVKFVLPPSSVLLRKFRLVSQAASAINSISSFQKRNFTNYANVANQGNYLIISNDALFTSSTGANNVDLYKQYRSSAAGGGFNTKIVNIDELEDQFAYGIKKHPSSIKDFLVYAKNTFSVTPKFVFLIGKGVTYDEYVANRASVYADKLNLVPTFGSPASDVLLSSPYGSPVPGIPIGRLSAVSGDEVGNYLQKVKEYEQVQNSTEQTLANKLWMKNVVQTVGGKTNDESNIFRSFMSRYKNVIEDTSYGAHVELFSKTSNSAVQLAAGQRIEQLFSEGISLLAYFGHSSANVLEFNLSDPSAYNNPGRYPFFLVSGCIAGNNYIFDTLRILQKNLSISENFVLSSQRGSIAFLASTHYGIAPQLDDYNTLLYNQLGVENYGAAVGNDIKNVIEKLVKQSPNDYFTRADFEEMTLHGDPALKINPHAKPDYIIEDPLVKISPAFISVSEEKFTLDAKAFNIGKAVKDSITFEVKRTYPNGSTDVLLRKRIKGTNYADSVRLSIPIISTRDKGLNKITITIDADNDVSEMSETNNSITKEFYIFEDEARPAYPNNFAIINVATQKLYASTANPLSVAKDYVMEMDTTELFNSPFKINRSLNSPGGVMEFDPGINYTDNTVYYWRVAVKPASGLPADYHWNSSSFIYMANSSVGSNQSHYFQQLYSDTQNIKLDTSRQWKFTRVTNVIEAKGGVFPTAVSTATDFAANVNGANFVESVCGVSGIIFNVLDPISLKPWFNNPVGSPGRFGSDPLCGDDRLANFQFNILDANKRKAAMNFLKDSIPDNYLVIARNISGTSPTSNTYATQWLADTANFGSGNSLYHELKSQGFYSIDSFNRPRAFIFMYQKNNPEFNPDFVFSEGIY